MPDISLENRSLSPKFGDFYEMNKPFSGNTPELQWSDFLILNSRATEIRSPSGKFFYCTAALAGHAPGTIREVRTKGINKDLIIFVDAKNPGLKSVFHDYTDPIRGIENQTEEELKKTLSERLIGNVQRASVLAGPEVIEALRWGEKNTGLFDLSQVEQNLKWFRARESSLLSCMRELVVGYADFPKFGGNRIKDDHRAAIFSHFLKFSNSESALSPISFWSSFNGWKLNREYALIDGANLISKELKRSASELLRTECLYPETNDLKLSAIIRGTIPINWAKCEEIPLAETFDVPEPVLCRFASPYGYISFRGAKLSLQKISDDYWIWNMSFVLDDKNNRDSLISYGCGWIERRKGFLRYLFG